MRNDAQQLQEKKISVELTLNEALALTGSDSVKIISWKSKPSIRSRSNWKSKL
ncbi:hypothetical protein LJK87_10585 [Paenibacillus sp. P25]|nr:hypothetical protein LJK87_10585 [Paenibacillus sp. P25]